MDPSTINRLGQLRYQEIVDWAAQQNRQPVRRSATPLHDLFSLIARQMRSLAQPIERKETDATAACRGGEHEGFNLG